MDLIGRYVVRGRLGSGGFAVVYLAHDPVVDADVAIKVLADHFADDPDVRTRFINEARVMRRIRSDRIVTVYDVAELPDGRPYLVMQFAERGTLEQRLDHLRTRGEAPTLADVREIAGGLGAALEAIHGVGVVHRDVKPSNVLLGVAARHSAPEAAAGCVLLRPEDVVMLADFGVAKDLDTTGRLTMVAGTHAYMAPEQRTVGAPIDGRTDLYAATVVLVEVLGGRPATGRTPKQALSQLDLPHSLASELTRALADDPAVRHSEAREWADAVRASVDRQRVSATRTPAEARGQHDHGDREARPRRRLAVVLALAAITAIAAIAILVATRPAGSVDARIVGPDAIGVGESAVFYAEVDDIEWNWVDPAGARRSGSELQITATTVGTLTVAVESAGKQLSSHRIDVVDVDDEVSIEAPARADVGDEVTLTAIPPDAIAYLWVAAGLSVERRQLVVRLDSPGTFDVELIATLPDGEHRARHTVTVVP